jgi:uncharacterized protein YecE (DUF72 family)
MSGFSYPEWVGDFYPPKTKREQMLAYYSTRFEAVEVNMTFRRRIDAKTVERWRESVGEGFRFTFKANAGITHYRRLVDAGEAVAMFLDALKPMGSRTGPVLFQTREDMVFDAGVVQSFCESLPEGWMYAFEPRHDSFNAPHVDDLFRRHGIARCLNDDVFDSIDYRPTAPFAYFRFHRVGYSANDLDRRADLVRSLAAAGADVYAFFAHEDNPESVRPALAFRELVRAT